MQYRDIEINRLGHANYHVQVRMMDGRELQLGCESSQKKAEHLADLFRTWNTYRLPEALQAMIDDRERIALKRAEEGR